MTHREVYDDWAYLWSIGPALDMTGGYGDQDDLSKLMKEPTEKVAMACLVDQIQYWFQAGIEHSGRGRCHRTDDRVEEIRKKYC